MVYHWRGFAAGLVSPIAAVLFLFIAVRDGFLRQNITFRSRQAVMEYSGSEAIWVDILFVVAAAICALAACKFWVSDGPLARD
jgi:hypothetical protein